MILFLFLLFPIGFVLYARNEGSQKIPRLVFTAVLGLFSAAVFCAYKYFFSPVYYLPQESFFLNFFYYFVNQVLIPLAVLSAAFIFFDGKDSLKERFEYLFGLTAGFYAVYIPFVVVCSDLPYPFFLLFAKPLLYFFMLLVFPRIADAFFDEQNWFSPLQKAVLVMTEAAVLLLPPAVEALWTCGVFVPVTVLLTVLYLAGCAFIYVKPFWKK